MQYIPHLKQGRYKTPTAKLIGSRSNPVSMKPTHADKYKVTLPNTVIQFTDFYAGSIFHSTRGTCTLSRDWYFFRHTVARLYSELYTEFTTPHTLNDVANHFKCGINVTENMTLRNVFNRIIKRLHELITVTLYKRHKTVYFPLPITLTHIVNNERNRIIGMDLIKLDTQWRKSMGIPYKNFLTGYQSAVSVYGINNVEHVTRVNYG
jgi:hypothetical protein